MDLQKWLDEHGLTHKQMGDRIGYDQSTITRACKGQFSAKLARDIYRETGGAVTANDMLGMVKPGSPQKAAS
jgi:hypothetical protein